MTDAWERVIGQPAAVTVLRRAVQADTVAHAWLLVGPAGVGQVEVVHALAMAINCPAPADDAGCGTCETCQRIGRGAHPAVADFEPDGAQHVVESVRGEWMAAATRTMTEGRRRVLRIARADRMNEAAQNAFLKILEEPPASVVWVLDVQDAAALLDTVVSRCRRLDLTPWGPEPMRELAARLQVDEDQREPLVRASLGSPERLRALADPQVAEARRAHLTILGRLATQGPGVVVPLAKELTTWASSRVEATKEANRRELEDLEASFGVDGGRGWPPGVKTRLTRRFERREREERRRALDLVLDDLAGWLRDLLVAGAGGPDEQLVNIDHVREVHRDTTLLSAAQVVACLEAVEACRDALDRNGNPDLQLERLLLALALPIYQQRMAAPAG